MMKIIKKLLVVAILLVLVALAFLAYMGMLIPLPVIEKTMGPYTIVYKSVTGPYRESGKVFDKVYKAAKEARIEAVDGLGIYYDNPSKVSANELRSDCGVVVKREDFSKLPQMRKQGYKVMTLPRRLSLVVEFPIRNMLSYMFGPMKSYPALANYAKEKGCKMATPYEYYDVQGKKILFIMQKVK